MPQFPEPDFIEVHGRISAARSISGRASPEPPQRSPRCVAVSLAMKYARLLILSLRHGPVPERRGMFGLSAEETTRLAEANDPQNILRLDA